MAIGEHGCIAAKRCLNICTRCHDPFVDLFKPGEVVMMPMPAVEDWRGPDTGWHVRVAFASRFNPRASIPLKVERTSNAKDDVERSAKRAKTDRPASTLSKPRSRRKAVSDGDEEKPFKKVKVTGGKQPITKGDCGYNRVPHPKALRAGCKGRMHKSTPAHARPARQAKFQTPLSAQVNLARTSGNPR
ncbi:hypothetical protein C8R43DRAFT_955848 [Mycena crocata]|nr:hypothetical protein C8R43DRAFT_955848 [Mycena crocata]